MRFYFITRHTLWVLLATASIGALLLLINRPMVLFQESGIIVFTPSTPLQILIVGALTLGLTGRTEQFEFSGVRSLPMLRFLNATMLAAAGFAAASGVSLVTLATGIDPGTVGAFAPLRAFLGLFGVALGVVAFTDMRLGALCTLPLVLLPAGFDLQTTALGPMLGFVLATANTAIPWVISIGLLVTGILLYTFRYSERNSPSSSRRALIDSRGRRRRAIIE